MKKAAIFLPSVALTPPLELTVCHARRLIAEGYELTTLEFGKHMIRSQFNQYGNILMHIYTLARQNQFSKFVSFHNKIYFKKISSRYSNVTGEENDRDNAAYISVMSTLASRFRVTDFNQLPLSWQARFPYLIQSYHLIYQNTVMAIKSEKISLLGVFNGRFFDSASTLR